MEQMELAEPKTNLPKVMAEIEKIKAKVGDLAIEMSANPVKTEEDFSLAVIQGKQANDAVKEFERKRDEVIKPAKNFVDKVKDTVKAITTPITAARDALRERCEAFNRKKREAQEKETAKLRLKQIELEKKALEADTAKEQNAILDKAAKVEAKVETVMAEKPKASTKHRDFEIVDAALIPREYLIPDEKALRKAGGTINDPLPTIPGVRFFDAESVRFS
jgi:hypothetical protein